MSSAPAPRLREPVPRRRGLRTPAGERPRLRAVPPAPAPAPRDGVRQRLAWWGVETVGFVTGAVIGLFWTPAAALLALLTAALICWSERR
jgi:hypothetical protein